MSRYRWISHVHYSSWQHSYNKIVFQILFYFPLNRWVKWVPYYHHFDLKEIITLVYMMMADIIIIHTGNLHSPYFYFNVFLWLGNCLVYSVINQLASPFLLFTTYILFILVKNFLILRFVCVIRFKKKKKVHVFIEEVLESVESLIKCFVYVQDSIFTPAK